MSANQLGFSQRAVTLKSLGMFLLESNDRHGGIMFELLPAPPQKRRCAWLSGWLSKDGLKRPGDNVCRLPFPLMVSQKLFIQMQIVNITW